MDPLGHSPARRRSGDEHLHADGHPLAGSLLDFWRWSASDLVSNATRGLFAEYLVRQAVGGDPEAVRQEWDAWDLTSPSGIRIEVKSAAYLQRWAQRRLSTIVFRTRPTYGWSADTGEVDAEPRWQADVWVFALLHHTEKASLDPLNVRQWSFHVVPTSVLATRTRSQHSIALKSLLGLCESAVAYEELAEAIERAAVVGRQATEAR